MQRISIIIIVLACSILITLTACGPLGGPNKPGQLFVEVAKGDLVVTVSGIGAIEVSNERKLAFGSGGKIDKLYINEGDNVDKGDVLARLDTSALELALTQAEVGLVQARVSRDEAEYNLNQLRDVLHASRDRIKIAESALNAAGEQIEAAEQAVAEAQKQLDEASITAPFDGVAGSVDADEGDNVSAMTTIIHLIDPTSMELNAEVDEIDIPWVKVGQRAITDVDALPGAQLEGNVTSISPLSIETAGLVVYEVRIGIDVADSYVLKAGMSASADIVVNERTNVLLVPNRAITRDSHGNPVVKVVVNEQIEEKRVLIGMDNGIDTEVLDGLNEGDMLVAKE